VVMLEKLLLVLNWDRLLLSVVFKVLGLSCTAVRALMLKIGRLLVGFI